MSVWTPRRRDLIVAAGVGAALYNSTLDVRADTSPLRPLLLDPALRIDVGLPSRGVFMLDGDLVRLWRQRLQPLIRQAGGARALARWDKALMLHGLAREHGWRVSMARLAPNRFQIDIGDTAWAAWS